MEIEVGAMLSEAGWRAMRGDVQQFSAWFGPGYDERITPEALAGLAEQMVGAKVRLYSGRLIGTVTEAHVDDTGIAYTAVVET